MHAPTIAYTAAGRHLALGVATVALVVTLQGLFIALVAAWVFKRFDVAERSLGEG